MTATHKSRSPPEQSITVSFLPCSCTQRRGAMTPGDALPGSCRRAEDIHPGYKSCRGRPSTTVEHTTLPPHVRWRTARWRRGFLYATALSKSSVRRRAACLPRLHGLWRCASRGAAAAAAGRRPTSASRPRPATPAAARASAQASAARRGTLAQVADEHRERGRPRRGRARPI